MVTEAKRVRTVRVDHQDGEIELPIIELGEGEGPTLSVVAGLHGCEFAGIEAARRLVAELEDQPPTGTLRVVPVANLPAFFERSEWVCPVDGKNPNRVFPGDPDGSYTEALAATIMREVVSGSDVVLDIHGGDIFEALVPYSGLRANDDPDLVARTEELARVYDLPFVVRTDALPGQVPGQGPLTEAALAEGIPAVLHESGGLAALDEEAIATHVKGMYNTLRHLDMLDGAPDVDDRQRSLRSEFWRVRQGGLFYGTADLGDEVAQGQAIGVVRDVFGREIERLEAPRNAWIIAVVECLSCKPDGIVYQVAY